MAEGCFVPKEESSAEIRQSRTILLLNVEGKNFFVILLRRMTSYVVDNGNVDTSVQKGGMPGFPGCLEHTSFISQLIKEEKETKGEHTVVWQRHIAKSPIRSLKQPLSTTIYQKSSPQL